MDDLEPSMASDHVSATFQSGGNRIERHEDQKEYLRS
jgi:hypothetical protein